MNDPVDASVNVVPVPESAAPVKCGSYTTGHHERAPGGLDVWSA
ncbi:hypothetical protein [Streptomyces sp. NBC_00038]|nr:hypothetical protein [Streptomyces sp. NBC_00038]MCX5561686.1 hypothetical protein [Streptomyces sp. NBC_00038]